MMEIIVWPSWEFYPIRQTATDLHTDLHIAIDMDQV